MSHSIIYDRKFIHTAIGIFPTVLMGSSNCTEFICDTRGRSREVLERSWASIHQDVCCSEEDLRKWAEDIAEANAIEIFKQKGKWVSGKQLPKWIANGIAAANTLEGYLKANPIRSFSGCIIIWTKDRTFPEREMFRYLHNNAELEEWYTEATQKAQQIQEENPDKSASIHVEFDGRDPLRVPASPIQGEVIAKVGCGYVKSYMTGRSIQLTDNAKDAVTFASAEEGEKELGVRWKNLRFVSSKVKQTEKNFVICVAGETFHAGLYIQKTTRSRLHFERTAEKAARYASQAAAIRQARSIELRFNIHTTKFDIIDLRDGSRKTVDFAEEHNAA